MLRYPLVVLFVLLSVSLAAADEHGLAGASCGVHDDYVVLCYSQNSVTPQSPTRYHAVLRAWAGEQANLGRGFVIVTYEVPSVEREATAFARARNVREQLGLTTSLPIAIQTRQGPTPERGEVHPIKVFVFTENAVSRISGNDALTAQVRAAAQSAIGRGFVNEDQEFITTLQGITQDETAQLVADIKENLLITVVPVWSPEPFHTQNQDRLGDQIRLNAQIPESQLVLKACTVYLLIDPDGATLYQSDYCRLRYSPGAVARAEPGMQGVELLRSAAREARSDPRSARPNPELLLVRAYRYATSSEEDGAAHAQDIVDFLYENANEFGFDTNGRARMQVSAAVIDAAKAIHAPAPDVDAASRLLGQSEQATVYPLLLRPQAEVALRIAMHLGECGRMQTLIQRYRSQARSSQLIQQVQSAYDSCVQDTITNCEIHGDGNNAYFDTHITFVNDGFSEEQFQQLVSRNIAYFFSLQGMSAEQEQFTFRTVTAPTRLAIADAGFNRPTIDERATRVVQGACSGDFTVVLSNAYFRPVSRTNTFYMSPPACVDSNLCRDIYVSRAIVMQHFRLPQKVDTITGPLPPPGSTDFAARLDREQAQLIVDRLRGLR